MSKAEAILGDLPQGMNADSDPVMRDGQAIVPASEDRPGKAWFCRSASDCSVCHGRTMVDMLLREAGEKEPLRVSRPCDCVYRAIQRAEATPQTPITMRSQQTATAEEERHRGRVERRRQQLAAAELMLRELLLAQESAVAPYLARVAELERQSEELFAAEQARLQAYNDRLDTVSRAQDAVGRAQEALAEAQAILQVERQRAEEAEAHLAEVQAVLAPYAAQLEAARDEAQKVANRRHRHRIQVQEERVAEARERLATLEQQPELPNSEVAA